MAGKFLSTVFDHPAVPEDDVNALKPTSLNFHHDLKATDNMRRAIAKLPQTLRYKWGEKDGIKARRQTYHDGFG